MSITKPLFHFFLGIFLSLSLGGCFKNAQPLPGVPELDLNRFMGTWYVVGNIPTFLEKNAFGSTENYTLNDDGSIKTIFSFRYGSCSGDLKSFEATGFPENNSVWRMQFLWPFKADYRVVYLEENYGLTIIGRQNRDYLWIMARNPEITDLKFRELTELSEQLGYDSKKIQKIPSCKL